MSEPDRVDVVDETVENAPANNGSTEFVPGSDDEGLADAFAGIRFRTSPNYPENMSPGVKRCVKALKKLQNDIIGVDVLFHKDVNDLMLKYAPQYEQLFEKRKEIVTAMREPTDEECDWPSDAEEDGGDGGDGNTDSLDVPAVLTNVVEGEVNPQPANPQPAELPKDGASELKGIPNFWLTVFKNEGTLFDMIEPHDEPILAHLQDVKLVINTSEKEGFSLEFHFEPNEFFTDTVLTKSYTMRYESDPEDPLQYEGPEIVKCSGCEIHWKDGKNVTRKQIEKKQKHKGTGVTRTVTRHVDGESFFNFFNPPTIPEHTEGSDLELDDDVEVALVMDYEVGLLLRKYIIPRAVLYFTGEAVGEDDSDEFDTENVDDEDDDEEHPAVPVNVQFGNVGGIALRSLDDA